jgi:ketosteroid isomerase-like protein
MLVAADDGEEEIVLLKRVLEDYYAAFSTLDVTAIFPYYHEPSMMVSPQGVTLFATHDALAATIVPGMEYFRAREFARSELTMLQLKLLSATSAVAAGVAVRYMTGGQELDRAGVMYLLQKSNDTWRIAVVAVHDANRRLRIE